MIVEFNYVIIAVEQVIEELSDEDKLTVARARKLQRFFSQPMNVAESFTGREGKYVTLKETIQGTREILEGKHDALREDMFYMAGSIDDIVPRSKDV
ncbi:MAG: hypothetical protein NVS4B11_04630 [Ktedonobacteraceae bacterium]